jgi:hypothetical protein
MGKVGYIMMKSFLRLVLLPVCLTLVLTQSMALPVQAATAWAPGYYTGWISFVARIDSTTKTDGMDGFVIEKFNGRGQLMVKINDQGAGGASIVLPVDISILGYGNIHFSTGNCTFSSTANAQSTYVRLRNEMTQMSDSFQVPISLASQIRFTTTNKASFGSLQGCEKAGDGNLTAMKKAMKVTTGEMTQLEFTVKTNDGQSVGGSCAISSWVKTTPVEGGQGVRSLPKCTWRVFKAASSNTTAEWIK